MATTITIAFSSHRPETLPLAESCMAAHDHIVIEEPPTPEIHRMLAGALSVDDYLLTADYEYPFFAEASARMLRRLHRGGRQIHPCEPFLEHLNAIHDRFAEGCRPEALRTDSRLWEVYRAERDATHRLLGFYKASVTGDFDVMVDAACAFAAADAARFALRDRLRARAITQLLADHNGKIYIEAGYLHLRLLRELRRLSPPATSIQPLYLLREVYRAAGQRSHLYNPGDLLTLALIFNRRPAIARQRLLAARSLIYNQLVSMEEDSSGGGTFPDACEDIRIIRFVNRLAWGDCHRLHTQFQTLDSLAARKRLVNLPL